MSIALSRTLVVSLVLNLLPLSRLVAGDAPRVPPSSGWAAEYLRSRIALSDAEVARVNRGDSVVRMVRHPGEREIAVIGVVAMTARAPAWTADFAGIERLKRSSPDFVGIGRLDIPPAATDLAGVEIEARTLPQLRKCEPGRCAMNLPAGAIERLRGDADSEQTFRDMLREIAAGYQREGDATLPVFASRPLPVSTADAGPPLLSRQPSLAQIAPRLASHFRECPPAPDRDIRDIFYWLREKSWKHEVVSLVHAAFDEEAIGSGHALVLAEKTFYANHYFRSALAVTGILDDASGAYLFYLNRSETDNGSAFNFIERALAGYLIPHRLSRRIVALRDRLSEQESVRLSR